MSSTSESNTSVTVRGWKPPEWLKWLSPLVVAAAMSGYNSISVRIHETQVAMQNLQERMPIDYVPRAEHIRNAEVDKRLSDEQNARLSRIEEKLDQVVLNQQSAGFAVREGAGVREGVPR